jgi:hypothetical protein
MTTNPPLELIAAPTMMETLSHENTHAHAPCDHRSSSMFLSLPL